MTHTPIEEPAELIGKLKNFAEKKPDAWRLPDLLGNVQYLGGWKGALMRHMGVFLAIGRMNDPETLSLIYMCDARVFEGECGKLIWSAAVKRQLLGIDRIEELFAYVERPETLGDAPFDWFVANHTNWPRELLLQHGVNPDCAAPPRAPFVEKLLAYKIPAAHNTRFTKAWPRFRLPMRPQRLSLWLTALELTSKLPVISILARVTQEVMSEGLRIDPDDFIERTGMPPDRFSPATRMRFRELLVIESFVDIWTHASPISEARPLNRVLLLDFETCIFDKIPEICQDARFFWTLDAKVAKLHLLAHNDRMNASDQAELERSFMRLRGGSFQEKPFATRRNFSGAMPRPAAGVED